MSLAPSPLSSPTATTSTAFATASNNYTSHSERGSIDGVLAFHGEYAPFVAVAASSVPALSRSASCGHAYTTPASSYLQLLHSQHHYPQQQQQTNLVAPPKLSRSQTTPTSVDAYFPPSLTAANEYAQLAELWSAARESAAAHHAVESSDALLDLFVASPPTDTESETFVQYDSYDNSSFAMPQFARSTSGSSTCSTWSNSSFSANTVSSPHSVTKIKTGSKTKKCTYAARRREVSALRKETAALSTTLETLQIQHQARLSAERERTRLARACDENERLRALVQSHELQLQLQASESLRVTEPRDSDADLALSDDVLAAVACAAAAEVAVN